jgi:hypothetical protein
MTAVLISGKLASCGQDQTGRTATDDEDVDLLGESVRQHRERWVRLLDEWVARPVAVEIELHLSCPSRVRPSSPWRVTPSDPGSGRLQARTNAMYTTQRQRWRVSHVLFSKEYKADRSQGGERRR